MSGFLPVVIMSALLAAASFAIGVLPLAFVFSNATLAKLSALGTGLLLGAALGVIIPEGIETLVISSPSTEFPTSTLALALLAGFTCMLVLEQILSPHSHAHPQPAPPPSPKPAAADVQFDVELGELERTEGIDIDWNRSTAAAAATAAKSPEGASSADSIARAYPLTLGLVLHALADGLALGASALSSGTGVSAVPSRLSLVVFLALVVHKAPTALALATSLLATALPRTQCKMHLAVFSAATPVGTLVSYVLLSILGARSEGRWPGIALLVSGGTFLYVATVVQPVRGSSADGLGTKTRTLLIVLGMVIPFAVGAVLGHGHGR